MAKTTAAEKEVKSLTGKKFPFEPSPEMTELAIHSLQTSKVSFGGLLKLIKNGYAVFLRDSTFHISEEGWNQVSMLYPKEVGVIQDRDQAIRDKRDRDKWEAEAIKRVVSLIEDGLLTIDEGDFYRLTEEGRATTSEKLAKAMKEPTWRWWIRDELLALDGTKVGDELTALTLWDCEDFRTVLKRVKGTLTPGDLDALGVKHRKLKRTEQLIRELVVEYIEMEEAPTGR